MPTMHHHHIPITTTPVIFFADPPLIVGSEMAAAPKRAPAQFCYVQLGKAAQTVTQLLRVAKHNPGTWEVRATEAHQVVHRAGRKPRMCGGRGRCQLDAPIQQ